MGDGFAFAHRVTHSVQHDIFQVWKQRGTCRSPKINQANTLIRRVLNSKAFSIWVLRGRYAKIFAKITMSGELVGKYKQNHVIIVVAIQLTYKRGNVPGLSSVRDVPKPVFLAAEAKAAA